MNNMYMKGYKLRIYPTEEQAKQLDEFIDLFRYVYNWGIAKEKEIYEKFQNGKSEYGFYSFIELCNLYNKERNKNENNWLKNLPLTTSRLALRNVINGYKRYFNKQNNHPHFKSKKTCKKSFNTRKDRFKLEDGFIKIEGIDSRISLNFNSDIKVNEYLGNPATNPVITRDKLGNYYISFSIEEEKQEINNSKSEGIGIDLGVRRTFTLSTGEIFNQPNEKLKKLDHKRRKYQRHITRDINRRLELSLRTKTKYEDIPKSKRAIKRELRLNKMYRKIHNIKDTFYHTITKQIVMRNPEFVCMETFSVMKIEKDSKRLSEYLCNTSFYDITTKMKNKCNKYNIPFIQAPNNFASTQICNGCGHKKKMYGYHTYKCPVCGMVEDRDINAAINLKNFGMAQMFNNSLELCA